jgi:cytochrome c oxidase cbb3-type subunit 3|uniref:Cytochrome c oxidase Cbb3-type subunit III n=1 Tax=Chloracidobacterium thermophilum TaxID=458033 RepID=A8DJF3_9BACT|nr:cytochrome c oxidase Cbb3-type subunit III [Chloracidobacterium thermophilum]
MMDNVKTLVLVALTATVTTGCFVGARSASEPRMGSSHLAASRTAPAYLREAQVLYEGSTDGLPKDTPAEEIAHYKAMLAELQSRNYAACAGCHQVNGGGNKAINATNFQDPGWQANNSSPGMVTSILYGKGKVMPAYKDKLTLQQINYLVEYIRRFEKKRTDAAPITAGIPVGTPPTGQPSAAEEVTVRR